MNRNLMQTVAFLPIGAVFPFASIASECPITLPADSPVATGLSDSGTHDWYGSEDLAALIPTDGHWVGMGPARDFGDKFWWWRKGYNATREPSPDLKVTASRLDEDSSVVTISDATSGWNDTWNAMLIGMEFPAPGCWEVTGTYNGTIELTIVLLVGM